MPKGEINTSSESINLNDLIQKVSVITKSVDPSQHRAAVEACMQENISKLDFDGIKFNGHTDGGYARKLMHCDIDGHFSLLLLHWLPGAKTPVHGHHAWGVVSVADGIIGNESFDLVEIETGGICANTSSNGTAGAGKVVSVGAYPEGVHRLYNPTNEEALTVHIYGMDLSTNPLEVNVML